MTITQSLRKAICSLFEVHADEGGTQRIITPLEYPGSNDQIIVRVRPTQDGQGFIIDENGEAAFHASLNGGDIDSDAVIRWTEDLTSSTPVQFSDDERIVAFANEQRLIAPYIFRVAEAAQQLHAIASARAERQTSDFKDRVKKIIQEIAKITHLEYESEVELPIAGGLKADHMLGTTSPLIVITATSPTRLLEAEVIYMQYRLEKKDGYILAVAENQSSVGKKQYERAAYYTNKTVIFNENAFGQLVTTETNGIH